CVLGGLINGVSSLERALDYTPQRFDAISPTDLLSFLVCAPVIRDPHFIYSQLHPRDLDRNLRLKSESVLLELDRLNHVAPEDLEARFHIGQVQVGKHIRDQREETIANRMPE